MAVPVEIQRLPECMPVVLRQPERRHRLRFRMPFAKTEWHVREIETRPLDEPLHLIEGVVGSTPLRLGITADLLQAGLMLAPKPVQRNELSGPTIALLLEHLMSQALGAIEERLGRPIRFDTLTGPERPVAPTSLAFEVETPAGWQPVRLWLGDGVESGQIHAVLVEISGQPMRVPPGLMVMIGPIYLPRDDSRLAIGDQLLITEKDQESLTGVVFLDQRDGWPVQLFETFSDITGPLRSFPVGESGARLSQLRTLFLDWGRTQESTSIQQGLRLRHEPVSPDAIPLIEDGRQIATCQLVKLEPGLALEVLRVDAGA
ncbi:hypothetical protein [Rhabdaerophilum sp. SD176]|uniref:hypothetical protein n=1 Tax=Rhabdaerophilum sp. SD176 TaxID=2983548 RepID=UPI0024E02D06|nr:hypothetical protein [Rhabdaerophilum sp. SD176]